MNEFDLPFKVSLSFEELINKYKDRLEHEKNPINKGYLEQLLKYLESYPELVQGVTDESRLADLEEPLQLLLGDLFPKALTLNEIKAVAVPFRQDFFFYSERFKNIINTAGEDVELKLTNFSEDQMYIMACNVILGVHYGVLTDYKKPFYYSLPDAEGNLRTYKAAINADFIQIKPLTKAGEITQEDIDRLLQSYNDITVWKEMFPPNSWECKGFTIVNLIDVTVDKIISDMKSNMLSHTVHNDTFDDFEINFRRLFNNESIRLGFTAYEKDIDRFVVTPGKATHSYILHNLDEIRCDAELCDESYDHIIKKKKYMAVADVAKFAAMSNNQMLKSLAEQGVKSCIIAPIVADDELIGILEIVSPNKNDLNTINANKLDDILPYIIATAKRSVQESENHIKAIIQSECTSIHPTVLWKFEEEAKRFLNDQLNTGMATFKDIVFDYVYPLFGQIDIIGSSVARNNAIQGDFLEQLGLVATIFKNARSIEKLPFYEQIVHRLNRFSENVKETFNTSSEEQLLNFLRNEINPIMPHIKNLSTELAAEVEAYEQTINPETGIVYKRRRGYEDTVQQINRKMARLIDKRQKDAQVVYPHFFERFKTDGVEHNMYIGESLVKNKAYNKVYLHNLRLWQLITMCEMENKFYNLQEKLPMRLDCASLVLVFSNNLSIRYRVDERKFDVDGSYNARYEIIKKRIDKANIKGTNERITQKGKLVIVYSQKKDELEYLRYIDYLQSKNILEKDIELVELENLQGVVGLKAMRVNIVYNNQAEKITYKDLINEIEN